MIRILLRGTLWLALLFVINTWAKPTQSDIKQVAKQSNLPQKKVAAILNRAHYLPDIIKKITTPYESKPYDVYRKHFLSQRRIDEGNQYWQQHAKVLRQAEKKYGVDPSVIVAIIGVESYYGKIKGSYRVLDSLYTLSFFYPARADFFSSELANYLIMCHNQHLSPYKIKGSYAGAFGMPQFMPSSYRAYGVDYHHNHHVNLMSDSDDVIMSVANFLAKNGWQHNQPIAGKLHPSYPKILQKYLKNNANTITIAELAEHKIFAKIAASEPDSARIIQLKNKKSSSYWVTFNNFQSIMHYNTSVNYAMAVYQLSQAIQQQHERHTT